MKNFSLKEFFSANPYRDWVLILGTLLLLLLGVAILDARFFLSATQKSGVEAGNNKTSFFDANLLKKAVLERKAQEKAFGNK